MNLKRISKEPDVKILVPKVKFGSQNFRFVKNVW